MQIFALLSNVLSSDVGDLHLSGSVAKGLYGGLCGGLGGTHIHIHIHTEGARYPCRIGWPRLLGHRDVIKL